jgi:hypothetical protein
MGKPLDYTQENPDLQQRNVLMRREVKLTSEGGKDGFAGVTGEAEERCEAGRV